MNYKTSKVIPIHDFLVIVDDLKKSPFIKKIKIIKAILKFKRKEFMLNGFSEHYLRSVLLDFRKLYMVKEPTNLNKICKLVIEISSDNNFIKRVNKIESRWIEVLAENIYYSKAILDSNKDVLDRWFNGHYFHRDKIKYDKLNSMQFIKPVHKLVFVATIIKLSGIAIELGTLIESSSDITPTH